MLEHAKYEELCALAAAGRISDEEFAELQTHLRECCLCKELRKEFVDINSIWLTQAQELEPEMHGRRVALRNKILETLQVAGAQFSEPLRNQIATPPKKLRYFAVLQSPAPLWAAAALVLFAAFLGFEIGTRKHASKENTNNAAIRSVDALTPQPNDSGFNSKAQSDTPGAQNSPKDLEQKLTASEAARTKALADIQSLRQGIADLQSNRDKDANQLAQLKAHSEQDQSATISAQAQTRALKDAKTRRMRTWLRHRCSYETWRVSLRISALSAERERTLTEVSSSSEMRDVIASRNLHIVDVADVANSGVQKPFGRIFYTEGKSLIFYAYDFRVPRAQKPFTRGDIGRATPIQLKSLALFISTIPPSDAGFSSPATRKCWHRLIRCT